MRRPIGDVAAVRREIRAAGALFPVSRHAPAAQEYRADRAGVSRAGARRIPTIRRRWCWRAGRAGSTIRHGRRAWTALSSPGYVDDADKGALYAGALALVFPSLYEGFGFPVLEAMHCGTPVICSNTSSLPELAGDAALLVDPLDVDAIAEAMGALAGDEMLRAALIARGHEQARKFTWDAAARAALEAFSSALKVRKPLEKSKGVS